MLKSPGEIAREKAEAAGRPDDWEQFLDGDQITKVGGIRKCPYCAEEVKQEAILCKHCKSNLEPLAPTIAATQTTSPIPSISPMPIETDNDQTISPPRISRRLGDAWSASLGTMAPRKTSASTARKMRAPRLATGSDNPSAAA